LEAVESFSPPIVLIAGGSDKRLELDPLVDAVRTVTGGGGIVLLLSGDATDRLIDVLRREELPFTGPYVSLETACRAAREWAVDYARKARAGTGAPLPVTVLLSPGAASFGMFKNEFDRGDRFRAIARGAH
jgi:UDP-N-acetylmuramoylalanine--D-glutamate ligase